MDYVCYFVCFVELELIDWEWWMVECCIKVVKFFVVKSFDSFDFSVILKFNKMQVLELVCCEWIDCCENVIVFGLSGMGKMYIVFGFGLVVCQKGFFVGFIIVVSLVSEMMEVCDECCLFCFQK